MSDYLDVNRGAMPPAFGTRFAPQALAGAGTTESSNTVPFKEDRMHVLTVGDAAVFALFRAEAGVANAVGATDALLPAGSVIRFRSTPDAKYLYVEAADGAATYQVSVWQVEP